MSNHCFFIQKTYSNFEFYLSLALNNGEKMKKMKLFLLICSLSVFTVVFAYERTYSNTVTTSEEDPIQTIQSAIIKLNQLTTATTYSPQMMVFLVNQEITPLFDFNHIASKVLWANNVTLEKEEEIFFSNTLKRNIIVTLLAKLGQGRTGSFDFISARPGKNSDIIVRLRAKGYSRFGINLDLSFHNNQSGKWKIFDVKLNHDSLINYYQRMVSIKIRRYGVYGMLGRI